MRVIKNNIISSFEQLKVLLRNGKLYSTNLKENIYILLKNIDVPLKFITNLLNDYILRIEQFLHNISFKYQHLIATIKRKSAETRQKIINALKIEALKLVEEVSELFDYYKILKDIKTLYANILNWYSDYILSTVNGILEHLHW